MIHYPIFFGYGRAILRDDLGADDPFGLAPAEIVARIAARGYVPDVTRGQGEAFRTSGTVTEARVDGRTYLVAVSRDAKEIGVQEVRADGDGYDPE